MPHRANEKSAEIQTLVICARKQLDAASRENLSELAARPLDWPLLLRLADENGLLPLLHKHFLECAPAAIPPAFQMRLSEQNRENAFRTLFLTAELFQILDEFRRRAIAAIPYKGPVLAARAYGSPSLRQFDDLDIVAAQKSMPAIYEAMASLGYQARFPRERLLANKSRDIPGEYVFVLPARRAMVEIHTEATLRHFPAPPDVEAMIRRAVTVSVDGKNAPAFAAEDDLLLLAVHGAKDFWARLVWVVDVAELVQQSPRIDWQGLFAEADRLKVTRMLNLGFSLAHEILGLPLPREAANRLQVGGAVKHLSRDLAGCLFNCKRLPEGIFRRSLYRIRMTEGIWNGLRYWARLSTAPAEEDWAMTDLPRHFSAPYAFLRPFRLWKKYGRGASRGQ